MSGAHKTISIFGNPDNLTLNTRLLKGLYLKNKDKKYSFTMPNNDDILKLDILSSAGCPSPKYLLEM